MEQTHIITLRDGRKLGYADLGVQNGFPVIYCHGWPSGKYEGLYFDDTAKKYGIRFLSVDRPGMGDSDFKKDLTYLEWADDIEQLMAELKIEKFGTFAVSGGSAFALTCAYKFPERVRNTYLYGALSPVNVKSFGLRFAILKRVFWVWAAFPKITRLGIDLFRKILTKRPNLYLNLLKIRIPKEDTIRASNEGIEIFMKNKLDSVKNGPQGAFREIKLMLGSWGFELRDIKTHVECWIGTSDDLTPVSMTEYLVSELPNAKVTKVENGEHFALTQVVDEIFETMKKDYANN